MRLVTKRRLEEIEQDAWQAGYEEASKEAESDEDAAYRRGYHLGYSTGYAEGGAEAEDFNPRSLPYWGGDGITIEHRRGDELTAEEAEQIRGLFATGVFPEN